MYILGDNEVTFPTSKNMALDHFKMLCYSEIYDIQELKGTWESRGYRTRYRQQDNLT
jgi:hypothetical protein